MNPSIQAFLAGLFTWFLTVLGSAMVFFFKSINKKILNSMLGFAAGVMISASFWSLLLPAIEIAKKNSDKPWIPAVIGFLTGGVFLFAIDKLIPHLHQGLKIEKAEGIKTSLQRSILLILAITIHNIPEGLSVGIAFGSTESSAGLTTIGGAMALAIGLGIQNLPEGAAVAIPLRREGFSRIKSFFYGQISGLVEPISALIGAYTVTIAGSILPYALSFAAGAMIYVVVEELIPEAQQGEGETDLSTIGAMIGFAIMMFLDVALG